MRPQSLSAVQGVGGASTTPHFMSLLWCLSLCSARQACLPNFNIDGVVLTYNTACSFPIIARRFPRLPIPHHALFLSRHFGTGVLIATAFVHLLPTAFVSMTDPCLPAFWNDGYPAMAGLVAMVAVLLVVGIEMFFATRGAGHMHGSEYDKVPEENSHANQSTVENGHALPKRQRGQMPRRFSQGPIGDQVRESSATEVAMDGLLEQQVWSRPPSSPKPSLVVARNTKAKSNEDNTSQTEDSDLDLDELDPTTSNDGVDLLQSNSHAGAKPAELTHTQQQKLLLQCFLLEAGILFHSVFIGIALSVSTGSPFAVLLVAISFHQTFEGLALGSRIASVALPASSVKPWLMALAYGTTTPIGQAIGLAVHGLYDPKGQGGLLMVGIMNAVSSGLLLFAGLVELLAEDFLSESSYGTLRGRRRIEACGAVVGGAALMALVGAWA